MIDESFKPATFFFGYIYVAETFPHMEQRFLADMEIYTTVNDKCLNLSQTHILVCLGYGIKDVLFLVVTDLFLPSSFFQVLFFCAYCFWLHVGFTLRTADISYPELNGKTC